MVTSFVAVGLFVATIGFAIGLDGDLFRKVSAVILGVFGLVLLSRHLQDLIASATSAVSQRGNAVINRISTDGLAGQFLLGLLLGAVWSPCVGPTLGAASVLAAQGRDLPMVAVIMVFFGLGAAIPVLFVGLVSRSALSRVRTGLVKTATWGKYLLGGLMLLMAALILTGLDHNLEAWLLSVLPVGLTDLTTRF
ncbi:hypothetical protein ABAC402_12595 [Asticcacaulis sp. AC402]|nr:hypothetical protein ABAC402_12595 [Asticcacaulis sp. AC402]